MELLKNFRSLTKVKPSDDICDAIRFYTYKGNNIMNHYVKNGLTCDDIAPYLRFIYDEIRIKVYDHNVGTILRSYYQNLMAGFIKLSYSIMVYRGMTQKLHGVTNVGDEFISEIFTSTSLSEYVAEGFSREDGECHTLLHITIPEGNHVLPVHPSCRSVYVRKEEYEVVLPPYSTFRIDAIQESHLAGGKPLYIYHCTLKSDNYLAQLTQIPKECVCILEDKSPIEVLTKVLMELHAYKRIDHSNTVTIMGRQYGKYDANVVFDEPILKHILPIVYPHFKTDYDIYKVINIDIKSMIDDNGNILYSMLLEHIKSYQDKYR